MCSWLIFAITTSFLLHKLSSEPHLLPILSNSFLLLSNIPFRTVILLRWFILTLKLLVRDHVLNVLLLIHIHFVFLCLILWLFPHILMILRSWPILRIILVLQIIATLRTYCTWFFINSLIDIHSSTHQGVAWRKLIKLHF